MIAAAIIGLGWWGQNLVTSGRGSAAITFTTAHTRTRTSAAEFCSEAELRWVGALDEVFPITRSMRWCSRRRIRST
jgi:hypothetical protein